VDGDGLGDGDGDGDAVGDAEDVGLVAVGDACGVGDRDGDGELLLDGVPGDVTVSIAGTMSAGAGAGKAPGDDDALGGGVDGGVPGDDARPAGTARVAAAFGRRTSADGCPAAPDRAKLTAADAASTPAVTPAATSGRHQRCRDSWSRPRDRADRGDRADPDQVRPETSRPEAGAAPGEAGRTAAAP
jgi:hypothetical protein